MKPWLPPLAAEIINPNIANIEVGELPDTSLMSALLTCLTSRSRKYILTISLGQEIWRYSAHLRWESRQPRRMRFYRLQLRIRQIHLICTSWTSVTRRFFALKDLPQVADYISFDDTEKFRKLRNILSDEISARKKKFARFNVTNLEMYNASGSEIMPAIVVVIDNYDVIKEIDYDLENYFTQLTRDGGRSRNLHTCDSNKGKRYEVCGVK